MAFCKKNKAFWMLFLSRHKVLFNSIFAVLLIGLPVALLSINKINYFGIVSFAAIINLAIIIIMLLREFYSTKTGIARIVFYCFCYVWMGIVPLLNVFTQQYIWYVPGFKTQLMAFFCLFIGYISFEVGYAKFLLGKLSNTRKAIKKPKSSITLINEQRNVDSEFLASFIAICLFALSGVALLILLSLPKLLYHDVFKINNFHIPEYIFLTIRYSYRALFYIAFLASCILCFKILEARNRIQKKMILFSVFIFILLLFTNNPLAVPRLWFGAVFLSCFYILSIRYKNCTNRFLLILLSFFMIFIFNLFAGRSIGAILNGEHSVLDFIKGDFYNLQKAATWDAFLMLNMTIDYVAKFGHSYGYQLLLPLLFFVPRSFWPNKPIGSGSLVSLEWPVSNNNLSSPLWAEAYLNFNYIGVIIFFVALGYVCRRIDCFFQSSITVRHYYAKFIISVFFVFNQYILLRGDINSGTNFLFVVIFFATMFEILKAALFWFLNRKKNLNMYNSDHADFAGN